MERDGHHSLGTLKVAQIVSAISLGDGVSRVAADIAIGLAASGLRTDFYVLTGRTGPLEQELVRNNIRVFHLHAVSSLNPRYFLRNGAAVLNLSRRLRRNGYDIVHCHEFFSGTLGRVSALLAGKPALVTQHNIDRWKRWPHFLVDRFLDRCTSAYTANSRAVADFYRGRGRFPPRKVHVIHNGIDTGRYAGISPGNRREHLVIGSVGRLAKQKGYSTLVQAARLVLNELPSARFVVVGPDAHRTESERDVVENLIAGLGLEGRFELAKPVGDVGLFLAGLDIFVLPSRWEGFGLAVVEAMAAGLPVVSTRVGGIPEVVEEGEDGILVPPDDPGALAGALVKLAADPALRLQMGRAGRLRATALFDREAMASAYGALYRGVAAAGSRETCP